MRPLAATLFFLSVLPAADFTTYIGDANDYRVARVVADASGNTYIAGTRAGGMFAMKLDTAGKTVVFATLSGKGTDQPNDLAVDAAGNLYLAGATTSSLLPLRNAFQSTPGPGFVVKFSPDATQILYSTYFPAAIQSLALDTVGNIYVAGSTYSSTFPVTPGLPAGTVAPPGINATSAAYLTKISAAGDRILYSTRISGHQKNCGAGSTCFLSSRSTVASALTVDSAGNAYLAGNTDTADLPATPGALLAQGTGAFVAKVNAAGSALVYLTYLGPGYRPLSPNTNPANLVNGIAADAAGNAYLTGSTFDDQFPASAGAWQAKRSGGTDAFAAKLNPQGSAVVWATYLGGASDDVAQAIALDSAGSVWLSGTTASPEFPIRQGWSNGGGDFVAGLNAAGSALTYSTRLPDDTAAATLAVDAAVTLHFAGYGGLVSTLSPAQPLAPRIFGIASAAFGPVGGRVVGGELISIYGPHIGPAAPVTAVAGSSGMMPRALGGVQVSVNGSPVPLLYVSDSQVNAVAPLFLSGLTANVRVTFNGTNTSDFLATVLQSIPEIFQGANGTAAAINQDGTINSPDHPAQPGSIVAIWATGIGATPFGVWQDGQIAAGATDLGCCQIWAQDSPAAVLYGGTAPGIVAGVAQINFRIPAQVIAYGPTVPITLGVPEVTSHPVQLYVVIPD